MATTFKPSTLFDRAIRSDPLYVTALEHIADHVVSLARANAPVEEVASAGRQPGDYRKSINWETSRGGRVKVVADDEIATMIEFGTGLPGPTPRFAVLRKAAIHAGLRFKSKKPR